MPVFTQLGYILDSFCLRCEYLNKGFRLIVQLRKLSDTFAQILDEMAVTRLERKAARNKTRAKVRVATIKRNKTRNYIASPHKEESGVVLEEDTLAIVEEVKNAAKAPAKKAKKEEPKAEAPAEAPVEEKEAAPAKAEKAEKPAKKKAADKADKLNKIEGIGPKIASVLNEAGINSFDNLAASTPEAIREILDNAEGNFKAHDPATWPEQANMAAEGNWDALKEWQDNHIGGKAN